MPAPFRRKRALLSHHAVKLSPPQASAFHPMRKPSWDKGAKRLFSTPVQSSGVFRGSGKLPAARTTQPGMHPIPENPFAPCSLRVL